MRAILIKALGKVFIKSDYNQGFIKELKKAIPSNKRRWNGSHPIGFFYRLMDGIPREELLNQMNIVSNIKELWDKGILKKTWEVDDIYIDYVRDLSLKYYLEVYMSEDGHTVRILSSENLDYEKIRASHERLLSQAEKYRPGEPVSFQWDFEACSEGESKDNLKFQFYSPFLGEWVFATNFSEGPKADIAPCVSSHMLNFDLLLSEKGYSYRWEGSFSCPENTLFKFKNNFFLVTGKDKLIYLGAELDGWGQAQQILEYQNILMKLNEIEDERNKLTRIFNENLFEIIDMETSPEVNIQSRALEIIEKEIT